MKAVILSDEHRKISLNWESINAYTSRWKPNTPFEFELVKRQPRKSDPMRKYYFSAVIPPFMKELGYDDDEELLFHFQLKVRYFENKDKGLGAVGLNPVHCDERGIWRNVPSVFGNESQIPVNDESGSGVSKIDFMEWVIRKASQAGVYIEPSEDN